MLIKNNQGHTTRDIAEIHHISHMSAERHLKSLRYTNCYDIWVTDILMEKIINCIYYCDSFNRHKTFLKSTITRDENGLFITMCCKNDPRKSEMIHRVPFQKSLCIQRRWWYIFAGIRKTLCFYLFKVFLSNQLIQQFS